MGDDEATESEYVDSHPLTSDNDNNKFQYQKCWESRSKICCFPDLCAENGCIGEHKDVS